MNTLKQDLLSRAKSKAPLLPFIALLITMLIFGSAFPSSKFVVGALPFEVAAALRFCGGSILLLLLSFIMHRKKDSISITVSGKFAVTGILGVFAYNALFFLGLSLAPSMDGSVIVPVLSPIITIVVLLILGKEKTTLSKSCGLLLGVVGASVFLFGATNDQSSSNNRMLGDLYFVLAAGCWGIYSILSKKLFSQYSLSPLLATTCSTIGGTILLVAFSLDELVKVDWANIPPLVWANLAYLAIGPTAIAYLLYFYALRSVSASTATVMMFTVPVFGIFSSSLFLDEFFLPVQVLGAGLMLIGSLIATGIATSFKGNKGKASL